MMRMLRAAFAVAVLLVASSALAETVTVMVHGVASDEGFVRGALCSDPAKFPGLSCPGYKADAPARKGSVDLVFEGVAPGTYAFTTWHDANADGRTKIPDEGFAFGNNTGPPPSFKAAALAVSGDLRTSVNMFYMVRPGAAGDVGAPAPPGVAKTAIRDAGLYGALYAPAGAPRLPAIVVISGSEGGLDIASNVGRSFATRGYVVLALAYWRAPGLPPALEGVRLEYFRQALDWLKARPEVDPAAIGILGMSRGGEAALMVAAQYPDVKAVLAVAPSSHRWPGGNARLLEDRGAPAPPQNAAWTLDGQPLPFLTQKPPPAGAPPGNLPPYLAALAAAPADAPSAIAVERINGPILLLSGRADGVWPAPQMSERIVARLRAKRFRYAYRHVDYRDAGHLVLLGDPADMAWAASFRTLGGVMGGTDAGNQAARADAWTRALAFFDKALKPRR